LDWAHFFSLTDSERNQKYKNKNQRTENRHQQGQMNCVRLTSFFGADSYFRLINIAWFPLANRITPVLDYLNEEGDGIRSRRNPSDLAETSMGFDRRVSAGDLWKRIPPA